MKPVTLEKAHIIAFNIGTVYRADVDDPVEAGQKRRVVFHSLPTATEQLRELGYYIRRIDTRRAKSEK